MLHHETIIRVSSVTFMFVKSPNVVISGFSIHKFVACQWQFFLEVVDNSKNNVFEMFTFSRASN